MIESGTDYDFQLTCFSLFDAVGIYAIYGVTCDVMCAVISLNCGVTCVVISVNCAVISVICAVIAVICAVIAVIDTVNSFTLLFQKRFKA